MPPATTPISFAARDQRAVPVTCSACGCRLEHAPDLEAWIHFRPTGGRDARGCDIPCASSLHDQRGVALR